MINLINVLFEKKERQENEVKTPYQIITAKKRFQELDREDIEGFVQGYVEGTVSAAQMAAFMMAVTFRGMLPEETLALTEAMAHTGHIIDTSDIPMLLDKHSTGGVGDKTTFLIASMLNAADYNVGMMSGRGLGHTGGTIDKLESILGFTANLTERQYLENLKEIGIAIISQTDNVAPADKLMYALRNETATIDSIPLIVGSIVSKKIASGTQNIVFDVKYGDGTFMKEKDDAQELARAMEEIARGHGMHTTSIISSMNDILGCAVGNAIEIQECLDIMDGKIAEGAEALVRLSLRLSSKLVCAAMEDDSIYEEIYARLESTLHDGTARASFEKMLVAQNADLTNGIVMPDYQPQKEIRATSSGVVSAIEVEQVGLINAQLGANRIQSNDLIYRDVGLDVKVHLGDEVRTGDVLAEINYGSMSKERITPDMLSYTVKELGDCWHIE